jgi:hypothetical protein
MASETVSDIILRIRGLHRQLGAYYMAVSETSTRERVKLLLNHIGRHERNLEQALLQYQQQASRAVLESWYKTALGNPLDPCLERAVITPDSKLADVVRTVLAADQCLVSQFRHLAESAPSEEVRTLFQKLVTIEEREEHQFVRDAFELEDI